MPPVKLVPDHVSVEKQTEKGTKEKNRQELEERVPEKNYTRLSCTLFPPPSFLLHSPFLPLLMECIFQIWSMKNYEELAGGFEPIRNGELF